MNLTGRTRYRLGFGKRLVLQVEIWSSNAAKRVVRWQPINWRRVWRDATVENMQALERGDFFAEPPNSLPHPPLPPGDRPKPRQVRDL